jgi:hypothetical protein
VPQCEITGKVIAVHKQWWLKINTKPIRKHALDGAIFPHVIKVQYQVDGKDYYKRKWISAGHPVPQVGDSVAITCYDDSPKMATIHL